MQRAPTVIGVSNHNGWAVFVRIAVRGGAPVVIDRRRVELIEAGLPNQPYEHETHDLNPAQAEQLVKEVRESALHCAERALGQLPSKGAQSQLVAIAMREAVLPAMPKSVAEAHASSHIMARADSMLYHQALCQAASALGIAVELIPRGDEQRRAADALKTSAEHLNQWLTGLRESIGAPWQKDHREATARAIVAFAKHVPLVLMST